MPNYSWYSNNASKNSPDTIHQILAYGTLSDIRSLKTDLGEELLRKLFITYPKKLYTPQAYNFIKKFILHISVPIDDQKYLTSTPRHT